MDKQKRGPKPFNDAPMTGSQRNRRNNAKNRFYKAAVAENGYLLTEVLISKQKLTLLMKYWYIDDCNLNNRCDWADKSESVAQRKITTKILNEVISSALNMYLEAMQQRLIGEGTPEDLVRSCGGDYDETGDIERIDLQAAKMFLEWEAINQPAKGY